MEKVLGLDLGTNSIGWAIRNISNDLGNQIIDRGVLTFEKGVAEDKSGEHPMVQKRTQCRGKRRNYQAEKYRKWELLKCLIMNGMCPLTIEELNEWRYYRKGFDRQYPQSQQFIEWLRFDFDGNGKPDFERLGYSPHESCYLFRKLIIDESQVDLFRKEPYIIGRVLYQLVQRRGFRDNDLDIEEAGEGESEKMKLSKTIMNGGGENGSAGASEIGPYIEKYRTLGAALYELQKENGVRIRKRYSLRSDYENELKEICRVQGLESLYNEFWAAIIWQRPLRSQKGLVGVCTFEKNKRRCPISHPLYEEYRTWVFINNLKIKPALQNNIPLNSMTLEEFLNKAVYPLFFRASKDFELSRIKKAIEKEGFEVTAKFRDDTKVISVSFLNKMKGIFGDDWDKILGWDDVLRGYQKKVEYDVEDLWHLHFTKSDNQRTSQSAYEFLKEFAAKRLKLNEENAKSFAKIGLPQGYATLSLSAIRKILPFLRKGFIYSEAVYLANLSKVMGRKLGEGDIENFSLIIKDVIRRDRSERRKMGIVNSLITAYFEDRGFFESNKTALIEEHIRKNYGDLFWNNLSFQMQINTEDEITSEIDTFLQEPKKKPHDHYRQTERLHDKIFIKLMDDYGVPAKNIKYLWHPSEQDVYAEATCYQEASFNGKSHYIPTDRIENFLNRNPSYMRGEFRGRLLGSPEPISKGFRNPMALKTLHYLKKLVNYLIVVGKIDQNTRVVVEIARELNDANKRRAIRKWQREREKENNEYKKQIEEINNECNTNFDVEDKKLIDKVRLWNEQGKTCIYTGKVIGLCDILDGSKYDFEHTVPASMSFDNELKNLTIADKKYNQQVKGKKLPTECPNYEEPILVDGVVYPAIKLTMEALFGPMTESIMKKKGGSVIKRSYKKIDDLEKLYAEWSAKTSDDKEIKDNIIIRRHLIKMDLDYWRYKLKAFTINEYRSGWRNSQLRDTQTVTKYATPYLRTVFNKVEVQRGITTAAFREVYDIQPRSTIKERVKHSHHAIDAAVLTLIPPAAIRDSILLRYNEAKERNQIYHEKPRQWDSFRCEYIKEIENDLLINYQIRHRTLTSTYKVLRRKGKIQYVKEKGTNGKRTYKLDGNGNKIPLVAKGRTIRGQLHKESFFGAIKHKGALQLVERYPISTFTQMSDCKHIVDDSVRTIVESELRTRMANGMSFDKAKQDPIPFPNGKAIIKKVRCKVAAGRGYLTPEKALEIRKHDRLSLYEYKQYVYAQNDENAACLYYEKCLNDKVQRAFNIIGLFDLSRLEIDDFDEIMNDDAYNRIEIGRGKKKVNLPVSCVLTTGMKVFLFEEHLEELKELEPIELSRRLFKIYKFNEVGPTKYIYLQNHIEARPDKDLGSGDVEVKIGQYQPRLKLIAEKFTVAIEKRDFILELDGAIKWMF